MRRTPGHQIFTASAATSKIGNWQTRPPPRIIASAPAARSAECPPPGLPTDCEKLLPRNDASLSHSSIRQQSTLCAQWRGQLPVQERMHRTFREAACDAGEHTTTPPRKPRAILQRKLPRPATY